MPLLQYSKDDTDLLRRLSVKLEPHHHLRYADFVNYYYASSPWCRLNLVVDDGGDVQAVLGQELMPFETPAGPLVLGFGSNFRTFQSGVGALLFLSWLKQCDQGLVFGGSPDTHRILTQQKWTQFSNVRIYQLNRPFADVPRETWWRQLAKFALRALPVRVAIDARSSEMLRSAETTVEAIPEKEFTDDMLPQHSPFSFRFAPDTNYLNWRYRTDLDFVRYRLFRIVSDGESRGYVVLNEQPNRVIVAQCDADDSVVLTRGMFVALGANCIGPRRRCGVLASSAHTGVNRAFEAFGFRSKRVGKPFAIGGLTRKYQIPDDTSNWLINYDWGDNGLRAPFLGQACL